MPAAVVLVDLITPRLITASLCLRATVASVVALHVALIVFDLRHFGSGVAVSSLRGLFADPRLADRGQEGTNPWCG
jgi:hypothetical protein